MSGTDHLTDIHHDDFSIYEAVKRLRDRRMAFDTDDMGMIYEQTKRLLEAQKPLHFGQPDPKRLKIGLPAYETWEDRRDNAVKMALSMPSHMMDIREGGFDYESSIEEKVAQVEQDVLALAATGADHRTVLLNRVLRRWDIENFGTSVISDENPLFIDPNPALSRETLEHNASLSPKMRADLSASQIGLPSLPEKSLGRKRTTPLKLEKVYARSPYARSRIQWRDREILKACNALQIVADWFDANLKDQYTICSSERFKVGMLFVSRTKRAAITHGGRLAIAITSADRPDRLGGEYVHNETLSRKVTHHYILFCFRRRSAKAKKMLGENRI